MIFYFYWKAFSGERDMFLKAPRDGGREKKEGIKCKKDSI